MFAASYNYSNSHSSGHGEPQNPQRSQGLIEYTLRVMAVQCYRFMSVLAVVFVLLSCLNQATDVPSSVDGQQQNILSSLRDSSSCWLHHTVGGSWVFSATGFTVTDIKHGVVCATHEGARGLWCSLICWLLCIVVLCRAVFFAPLTNPHTLPSRIAREANRR